MKTLALVCAMVISAMAEQQPTITTIVKDVKSDVKEFNYGSASEIGKSIDKTMKLFDDLTIKVQKSESYGEVFPDIVKTMDRVASNYEDIADHKDDISKSLYKQINAVQKQEIVCNTKIANLNGQISANQNKLLGETVDYRKTALETTIKFQQQELEVWTKFKKDLDFGELHSKMIQAKSGIERFVDILSQNAMVYRQASNTLKAMQDYQNATRDLQDVLGVMQMGDQLVASWGKVSILIDETMTHLDDVESNIK